MSVRNIFGAPFAILNKDGYYDLFDWKGEKISIPSEMIRITQRVNDLDKILLAGIVNVVRDADEMHEAIKQKS